MLHDMYLVKVKSPEESSEDWDYYEIIKTIPGNKAFLDPSKSECQLIQ